MKTNRLIFGLIFISLLIACSKSNEQGSFKAVDASGWNYGDTIFFDIPTADSIFSGDMLLTIRNSSSYPYSNLWVEISYPAEDSIKADTVNFRLADIDGNWLGTGLGLSFQRTDTAATDISLQSPIQIGVRHIMRTDKLCGIEQVGITLIPFDNSHD